MLQLIYDGTMAGLLTAIFEVYEQKAATPSICTEDRAQPDAFAVRKVLATDAAKARRVWKGLERKMPVAALDQFWYAHLSELPGMENTLLDYARYVFSSSGPMTGDFGHPAVLTVVQTARKVWREKHRMEAFVRFEQLQDGLYYATVSPDHNVLPLISAHFKSRYADQDWLIYDVRRKYGIHFQKRDQLVQEVRISWDGEDAAAKRAAYEPHESLYQQLWKDYFRSTGIPGRTNRKLHLQHIPLRYWKYLTEKQL